MNIGFKSLFFSFALVAGLSLSQSVFSDTLVSSAKLATIENSVNSMGVKELNLRKIRLNKYQAEYKNYSDQQERVNKLLLKLKFKDSEGNL